MEHTGIPASLYSSCRTTCMSPWDLGPCGVLWTLQVDQSGSEPTFNLQKPLSSSWTPVPISCRDRGDSCWALEVRAVMWHRDWDVSRWEKSWQWLTDWGGKWRSGMRKERYLTLLTSIANNREKKVVVFFQTSSLRMEMGVLFSAATKGISAWNRCKKVFIVCRENVLESLHVKFNAGKTKQICMSSLSLAKEKKKRKKKWGSQEGGNGGGFGS